MSEHCNIAIKNRVKVIDGWCSTAKVGDIGIVINVEPTVVYKDENGGDWLVTFITDSEKEVSILHYQLEVIYNKEE